MPRIDCTSIDRSPYRAIRDGGVKALSENRDCTVVAVAAACEVSYDVAHDAMTKAGRKPGRGAYVHQTHKAIESFGFKLERINASVFIAQYPKAHQILRSVTTHHPDRFKKVWKDGHTYLIHCAHHVLTVRDGVNMDWTRGKAMRAVLIYRVTKVATV